MVVAARDIWYQLETEHPQPEAVICLVMTSHGGLQTVLRFLLAARSLPYSPRHGAVQAGREEVGQVSLHHRRSQVFLQEGVEAGVAGDHACARG